MKIHCMFCNSKKSRKGAHGEQWYGLNGAKIRWKGVGYTYTCKECNRKYKKALLQLKIEETKNEISMYSNNPRFLQ